MADDSPTSHEDERRVREEQRAEVQRVLGETDYYRVLNVPRAATERDITKAYRRLCLLLHPDKNATHGEEGRQAFLHLKRAFETLSRPDRRVAYDTQGPEAARRLSFAPRMSVVSLDGNLASSFPPPRSAGNGGGSMGGGSMGMGLGASCNSARANVHLESEESELYSSARLQQQARQRQPCTRGFREQQREQEWSRRMYEPPRSLVRAAQRNERLKQEWQQLLDLQQRERQAQLDLRYQQMIASLRRDRQSLQSLRLGSS